MTGAGLVKEYPWVELEDIRQNRLTTQNIPRPLTFSRRFYLFFTPSGYIIYTVCQKKKRSERTIRRSLIKTSLQKGTLSTNIKVKPGVEQLIFRLSMRMSFSYCLMITVRFIFRVHRLRFPYILPSLCLHVSGQTGGGNRVAFAKGRCQ
jgi:hypothetical protein